MKYLQGSGYGVLLHHESKPLEATDEESVGEKNEKIEMTNTE